MNNAVESRKAPIMATLTHAETAPDAMIPRPCQLARVRRETHDTFTMELEPAGVDGPFAFRPGQFNMLYVYGVGEVPISISSDPGLSRTIKHTTREVGVVTRAMRQLKAGDTLGVRGPFGSAWPVADAQGNDIVIIAGGIGLAPLRPALYEVLARREHYGRVVLLYGTRTPNDILYKRELEQWRAQFDLEVHVTVDRSLGSWRGHVGVVTTLIPRAPFDPSNATALVCGPELMMRFTVDELLRRGVPKESIHISMERNMKCAVGLCGHCQIGPVFACKDGPVFRYDRIEPWFGKAEV
jgi:NAD(P)H-flavin reductase